MKRGDKAKKTKEAIVDAAFEVIVQNSISGASTAKIAVKAGVSKPLLHYHFNKKEAILSNVLDRVLERLLEIPLESAARNLPPFEEIKAIFQKYKETITAEPSLLVVFYDFWVHAYKEPEIREKIVERFDVFRGYLSQVVSEGVEKGDFLPEKSHMAPAIILGLLEGASLQLISDPKAFNFDLYQYISLDAIRAVTGYKGE
ncbi:MAG: TetR/AcrR family transcriptional regulator [Nitrospinota bacterium]